MPHALPPRWTDPSVLLLLDGATGTELAARGVDITGPAWSAAAVREAPDVLRDIHQDYLRAGADAVTANTFRAHRRSLARAGLGEAWASIVREAVEVAHAARDAVKPDAIALGSVAPLEDCYRPDLAPSRAECEREHRAMIETLLHAGTDGILIETMGTLREASAAATAAEALAPGRWMISCLCRSDGPPGVLLSGEPMVDLLPHCDGALAVGVNCLAAPDAAKHVRLLRALLPQLQRVMVYANTGQLDREGCWTDTDATDPQRYARYAGHWRDDGATIIGGCCGTTPATVRALCDCFTG